MNDVLLQITTLHASDAEAAQAGGADRLEVVGSTDDGGMSPEPAVVSSVVRSTDLPVRAMLRLSEGYGTTGGELVRLMGLAESYLAAGAEGVVFGFLTADLEIDLDVASRLVDTVSPAPWTFHRAIDSSLDLDRSWRQLHELAGIDAVRTAGSAVSVDRGLDELTRLAGADPWIADRMVVGGGLRAEQVPWLMRAGVRAFHLGATARPGGSWDRAYVDASYVRSWRLLLDDAVGQAATS
ncbi:MAG TPA: copper homeostasis protein CutC [Nocardioidaceae bacterium]|nr:copper homeostasis protein CutC [Nocardioidaceae bacterium]